MGLYDDYGGVQLKVGECEMREFRVGDQAGIPDGVYVGWEGLVVVVGGVFVAELPSLVAKWGDEYAAGDVLTALDSLVRRRGGG